MRTEDMPPRRLPVPERAAKLAAQRARLLGVSVTGMLIPSHALIDFCMTMRDEETLRYVAPDKCTAREQELAGVKREQFIKPDSQGHLKVEEWTSTNSADMTTEHRVRLALQRRALALDQCDLVPYSVMETYHTFLFSLIEAPAAPNHYAIDLVQILNADRAL